MLHQYYKSPWADTRGMLTSCLCRAQVERSAVAALACGDPPPSPPGPWRPPAPSGPHSHPGGHLSKHREAGGKEERRRREGGEERGGRGTRSDYRQMVHASRAGHGVKNVAAGYDSNSLSFSILFWKLLTSSCRRTLASDSRAFCCFSSWEGRRGVVLIGAQNDL